MIVRQKSEEALASVASMVVTPLLWSDNEVRTGDRRHGRHGSYPEICAGNKQW